MVVIYVNLYIYDNIIVDDKGHCCLADFGASSIVATHLPPHSHMSYSSTWWLCHELQMYNQTTYVPDDLPGRDIYALGCTVIEVCRFCTQKYPVIYSPSTYLHSRGFPTITLGVFTRIWKKKEGEKKNLEGSRPFVSMLKLLLFCTCNHSVSFFRAARAWDCINFSWS